MKLTTKKNNSCLFELILFPIYLPYNSIGMPIQIEVQDIHAQILIDFYVNRLKALRDEILDKERESKEINAIIHKLRRRDAAVPQSNGTNVLKASYSEKWPWVRKVHFALETNEKALTTKEIVDFLTEFEASFLFDRKRAVASVSSILSSKSGTGKEFIRLQGDSGDFAYAINADFNNTPSEEEEEDDGLPF
jgi:hypothetical protein